MSHPLPFVLFAALALIAVAPLARAAPDAHAPRTAPEPAHPTAEETPHIEDAAPALPAATSPAQDVVAPPAGAQSAAAADRTAAPGGGAPLDIALARKGSLARLPRDTPIHMSVRHSTTLARTLAQHLVAQGFTVVDDEEDAAIRLEIDGVFQARRQTTGRTAQILLGLLAEYPKSFHSERPASLDFVGGGTLLGTVVAQAVMLVSNVSGLRDAANRGAAGDPDGVCATHCDQRKFEQRAVVAVRTVTREGSTDAGVTATLTADDLLPDTLFARGLVDLGAQWGVALDDIVLPVVVRR
jgi:hypothetical protein